MSEGRETLVAGLLAKHGRGFAEELGVDLTRDLPSPLFRWLCACLLMSARISSDLARRGAAALADCGWTTAEALDHSAWDERVEALNISGYARFDEKTADMLGEMARKTIDEYGGDLRRLREKAGRDPARERKLLKEFKGIGDVGADIFLREAQLSWTENHPFADDRALSVARRLGLPDDAEGLAGLVDRETFPRLLAALIRADMADDGAQTLRGAAREAAR